jgi:tRNA(Ile)-lysidine synthase
MKNLIKYIQNINHRYSLWQKNEKIIVGVSGGSDSMALVNVLFKISQKENLQLIIAHINYGLRIDSDLDEKIVKNFADQNKIHCEILKDLNLSSKDLNENSWRKIRYNFFSKLKEKYQADKIAIAHNQNDQVETFLLHLLRGSGLNGLKGMILKNEQIIRPFLNVKKPIIVKYCQDNNIQYATDSSNIDKKYLRNKVRLDLIPYLEKNYNQQIISTLTKTATNIADDYDFLTTHLEKFWQFDDIKRKIIFSAQKFYQQHISIQRQSLRMMILKLNNHLENVENGTIEELRILIRSQKNKKQMMNFKNLKIVKNNDIVSIEHI